ncbi:MAG: hypothetical protein L3J02_01795, partial [Henriciella sp.]|nr:hypothetical protein [Henriciella sp.]
MQVKSWLTVAYAVAFVSSLAIAGYGVDDPNGKKCGKSGGATQAGTTGDGGIDNSRPINLSTGGFQ